MTTVTDGGFSMRNKLKKEEDERRTLAEMSKIERQEYKANKAKEAYYSSKLNEETESQSKQIKTCKILCFVTLGIY